MISERQKITQIQLDLYDFGWRVENCDRSSVISADRSTVLSTEINCFGRTTERSSNHRNTRSIIRSFTVTDFKCDVKFDLQGHLEVPMASEATKFAIRGNMQCIMHIDRDSFT